MVGEGYQDDVTLDNLHSVVQETDLQYEDGNMADDDIAGMPRPVHQLPLCQPCPGSNLAAKYSHNNWLTPGLAPFWLLRVYVGTHSIQIRKLQAASAVHRHFQTS